MTNGQETIIKLLGRIAFTEEYIMKIVKFKKGAKAQVYVNCYNACDGTRSVTELAKIVNVKANTLFPILKQWEEIGIVFVAQSSGGKFYKKVRTLGW